MNDVVAKSRTQMTEAEWRAEGARRFGDDQMHWRFKCPACGYVASAADYKAAGLSSRAVAFNCVGRARADARSAFAKGAGPCDYTSGGLFNINRLVVVTETGVEISMFEFAEPTA